MAHVDAVIGDLAALNVIKAVDKICDGGLACAGRADERDLLSRLGIERQVAQHGLLRHIGKVHAIEAHVAAQRHALAVRPDPEIVAALVFQTRFALVHLGRHVQHVEDALCARQRQHDGIELLGDLADALGKITDVKTGEAAIYSPDSNGMIQKSSKEDYKSVTLTTEVNASDYEYGVEISGAKYGVGHTFTVRAGKSKLYGKVKAIEKK